MHRDTLRSGAVVDISDNATVVVDEFHVIDRIPPNVTAKPNNDGSVTGHFGRCEDDRPNGIPIMDGWSSMVRLYHPHIDLPDGTWVLLHRTRLEKNADRGPPLESWDPPRQMSAFEDRSPGSHAWSKTWTGTASSKLLPSNGVRSAGLRFPAMRWRGLAVADASLSRTRPKRPRVHLEQL